MEEQMAEGRGRNRFPGMDERIAERLKALGYWNKHKDTPDVMRFCKEQGYIPQYVYEWLKGAMPSYENLKKLSEDLEAPMAWILLGEKEVREAYRWVTRR
jgi:hypothetical protein